MNDLVEFLRTRNGEVREWPMFLRTLAAALPTDPTALHEIADWIEADVEAKRRIIEDFTHWQPHDPGFDALEPVVQLLALPHAGHPDYEEAMRSA